MFVFMRMWDSIIVCVQEVKTNSACECYSYRAFLPNGEQDCVHGKERQQPIEFLFEANRVQLTAYRGCDISNKFIKCELNKR
jgi:hypothetical protein